MALHSAYDGLNGKRDRVRATLSEITPTEPPFRRRRGTTEIWTRQGCRRARWYRMNDA